MGEGAGGEGLHQGDRAGVKIEINPEKPVVSTEKSYNTF
jgi:hypothetical protein